MAGRWTLPWRITVHRAGQLCFSRNTFLANTSERCLWWCDEQWRLAAVFWAPKMSFKISRSTVKILQETRPPSNRHVAASATFVSRQWPFLLLAVNATNPEAFPPKKIIQVSSLHRSHPWAKPSDQEGVFPTPCALELHEPTCGCSGRDQDLPKAFQKLSRVYPTSCASHWCSLSVRDKWLHRNNTFADWKWFCYKIYNFKQ